jgi:trimeric autotransporter adhesin
MNSFKKIALAVAAAMTLGTVAVAPANANTMSVVATTWNGTAFAAPLTAGTALNTAIARPVPADNKIDNTDVLQLVATVTAGTNVTATATNATIVSALHDPAAPVGASSGSSTLTVATGTGDKATFYVYTKTTAIGTVVITNGPVTVTYYVQGTPGLINNLTVAAPASGAAGTKQDILVTASDVFGNKISGASITATVFAATSVLDSATAVAGTTLTDFGVAKFTATLPTTGTRSLIMFAPTVTSPVSTTTADVVGLTPRTLAPFAEIAVRDLVSELAAQTAAKDAALAAKAVADAAVVKAAADAVAAKAASDKALADAKVASDKALADAKVASDAALAAAVKVETDKAAAAKVASDAALAAKDAQIAKLTADNAVAIKSLKDAFNKLARQWNAKNPKARVTLVK